MYDCVLCEKNKVEGWIYNATFCSQCRKIKHYLNLYGDRVHEILDNVLSRESEKQNNKINLEIKKDIINKTYLLRSGSKNKAVVGDDQEDYEKPNEKSKKK